MEKAGAEEDVRKEDEEQVSKPKKEVLEDPLDKQVSDYILNILIKQYTVAHRDTLESVNYPHQQVRYSMYSNLIPYLFSDLSFSLDSITILAENCGENINYCVLRDNCWCYSLIDNFECTGEGRELG